MSPAFGGFGRLAVVQLLPHLLLAIPNKPKSALRRLGENERVSVSLAQAVDVSHDVVAAVSKVFPADQKGVNIFGYVSPRVDHGHHYPAASGEDLSPAAEKTVRQNDYTMMFVYFGIFVLAMVLVFGWCYFAAWSQRDSGTMFRTWGGFRGWIAKDERARLETIGDLPPSSGSFTKAKHAGIWAIMLNKLNLLLIFAPVGWACHWLQWGDTWSFIFNLAAMLPLANLMGVATEELACYTGQTIGGLLNATFGNAVELIVVVQTLRQGLLVVTKGTLIGSILANMLLVLGMAILFGGLFNADTGKIQKGKEQKFYAPAAMVQAQLLLFSAFIIAMPSMFAQAHHVEPAHVVSVSRVGSVFTLLGYVVYLVFQLYTHSDNMASDEEEESEEANVLAGTAIALLLGSTVLVAVSSEFMIHALEGFTKACGFSETFVGVILLPIVGNACEHSTAVVVALKDKMDLAIGIALGSTIQIALFVVPFSVICGWVLDVPMTLNFEEVNAWALVMSSLLVVCVLTSGRLYWLNGFLLVTAYVTLAILFFFSPDDSTP